MKKSKKDRSLVDSFIFREAKSEVDEVLKYEKERKDKNKVIKLRTNTEGTSKEHQRNNKGAIKECHVNNKGTIKEHHVNTKGTPTEKEQKRNTEGITSIYLTNKRLQVYEWFLKNGISGTYNKSQIVHSLGMSYMTIRKAIWQFEKIKLIISKYNKSIKEFEYTINDKIIIKNWYGNTKGTIEEHQRNNNPPPSYSSNNIITTTKNENIIKNNKALLTQLATDNYFGEEDYYLNFDILSLIEFFPALEIRFENNMEQIFSFLQDNIDKSIYAQSNGNVQNAPGLLISKIKKNSQINADSKFVSRKILFERKRLEEKKEELKELKKIQAEREKVELELYIARLTSEELRIIEKEAERQYKPEKFSKKEIEIPIIVEELIKEQFQKQKNI